MRKTIVIARERKMNVISVLTTRTINTVNVRLKQSARKRKSKMEKGKKQKNKNQHIVSKYEATTADYLR